MNPDLDDSLDDDLNRALAVAVDVATRGLSPAPEVTRGVRELTAGDPPVPADAARDAIERVIMGPRAGAGLQWMQESGLLPWLLPELSATVGFAQEIDRHHKDVWKHTRQVVDQSPRDAVVRWAALLHDVGKVPTRAVTPEGKVTFHAHAEVGARMVDRVARRLAFARALRVPVRFLVLHHLRANQYDGTWTDSAVRRFDREMGEHLDRLMQLSRADVTSAREHKVRAAREQLDELWARIVALREEDARVPPLPSGIGNQIMERFGLRPGPRIGELKRELERAVEAGELEERREPEYYLAYLEGRRDGGV